MDLSRKCSLTNEQVGVSWHDHSSTPITGISWETNQNAAEQDKTQQNKTKCSRTSLDTDGEFSSTRAFPGVRFDCKSNKKNHSEIPQWYGFIQKMFVNKWTSGCELTWSFLDTHIWHILRNKSKNAAEQDKMQQNKTKWSCNNATTLLLLKFLQWFLTLGLDSSFNKCTFLHAVVRWKGLVETKLCFCTFVTRLCPSLKLFLDFLV